MRLDLWLVEHQHFTTRTRAQAAIKEGLIQVNGKSETKPSHLVSPDDHVLVLGEAYTYVSRAALKLKHALEVFGFSVKDEVVLDIGSSTGGFTEVLLEFGAKEVIAIDVGTDQLAPKLRQDARVKVYENTHFLHADPALYAHATKAVCDVSFISSVPLLSRLAQSRPIDVIVLIKPQFEQRLGKKKDVIRDEKQRLKLLQDYQKRLSQEGLFMQALIPSPLQGSEGNVEYLAWVNTQPSNVELSLFKR